ncbi:accessory factor associated with RNA polymerase II [Xylographa trunciseda]|nr:accessory factor associated with RNA polymerase II [Xylographa trunciseda]
MQSPHNFRTSTPPSSKVEEPSYFRKWALRAANRSSSEDVSPRAVTASPRTTPTQKSTDATVAGSIYNSPLPTLHARRSVNKTNPFVRRSSSSNVRIGNPCSSTEPLALHETKSPRESAKSSASNRAPETLPDRRRRFSLSAPSNDQHAQGITEGRRWKREISSHLIELRVTKKAPQNGSTQVEDLSGSRSANQNKVDKQYGQEEAKSAGSALQGSGTAAAPSSSSREKKKETLGFSDVEFSEGLYCRARRRLGLKKGPVLMPDGEKSLSERDIETDMMLNHAADLLRDVSDHRSTYSGLSTGTSKLSIAAIHDRKGGYFSATSSLRNLFMGKEPRPSLDSAALYTGSDNEQYFRVDLSSPDAPNFLPSEARRVGTPPLPGGNGSKRPLRGFFFDFRPPGENSQATSPSWESSSATSKTSKASGLKSGGSDGKDAKERYWFRVRVQTNADKDTFEFNVPDHLPNSPLCARNPKHTSGGKGICPYHGRALTSSTQTSDSTEKVGKRE